MFSTVRTLQAVALVALVGYAAPDHTEQQLHDMQSAIMMQRNPALDYSGRVPASMHIHCATCTRGCLTLARMLPVVLVQGVLEASTPGTRN
jgi:hypothetical protein